MFPALIALVVAQAPSPEWDWRKVYPEYEKAEEQYLLWTSHLHRLRAMRPAWTELGTKRWDRWEEETEEIMQLWHLVMEARRPHAAGRRWFRATDTALENMREIMGDEAFRAGRLLKMPPGLYAPFMPPAAPAPVAPVIAVAGAIRP